MTLFKWNAQIKCRHCRKFRWGYLTMPGDPKEFLCGTCEKVTYFGNRNTNPAE